MSLIRTIRTVQGLTPREADIRDYVLEHPECVESMSSRELGGATYTSAATVTRFAKKVGCSGYPEFRVRFTRELVGNPASLAGEAPILLAPEDDLLSIVEKTHALEIQALQEMQNTLTLPQLSRLAELVKLHQYIDLYALDQELSLIQYAAALFEHAGKTSVTYTTSDRQLMHALASVTDSLAVLVSHTGDAANLLDISDELARNGTDQVVIAHSPAPRLAANAEVFVSTVVTFAAPQMWQCQFAGSVKYIFDIMFAFMFTHNYEDNMDRHSRYLGRLESFWGAQSARR